MMPSLCVLLLSGLIVDGIRVLKTSRTQATDTSEVAAGSGTVVAPFIYMPDSAYVELPLGSVNIAEASVGFSLHCSQATTVQFKAWVLALNGRHDSFRIQVEKVVKGGAKKRWNTGSGPTWKWSDDSPAFKISEGSGSVTLLGREDGIKFKFLKLVQGSESCHFSQAPTPVPTAAPPRAPTPAPAPAPDSCQCLQCGPSGRVAPWTSGMCKAKASIEGRACTSDPEYPFCVSSLNDYPCHCPGTVGERTEVPTAVVRDASSDNKKCATSGDPLPRVFKLLGGNAERQACIDACTQSSECVSMSGKFGKWCIGCKQPLTEANTGAQSYKKTEAPCAAGYAFNAGDILGWGKISGVGDGQAVPDCNQCASLCNGLAACLSYECSPTAKKCNLNTQRDPTIGVYQDFAFCSKE